MFIPYVSRRDWGFGPVTIVAAGKTLSANPTTNGGGKRGPIKSGQPFSGRLAGGATRGQIYGTRDYGSGYPEGVGRGVNGRWFPFYFWPIIWLGYTSNPSTLYLYSTQYGLPDNTSRPGGPLSTITYVSNTLSASTFRILTDQTTASYLTTSLVACNSYVNVSSDTPSLYPGNSPGTPLPVQALQYYRASSVVLTLDGYNNTAAMLPAGATSNTFLPGGIDANLLNCLNTTIGSTVLLIDPSNPLSGNAVVVIISASLATIAILAYLNCLILDRWRQKRITRTLPVCSAHALGTDKEIVTGPVARPPPAAVAQVPGVPYAPAPSSIDWCSVSTLEEHDSASLVRNARSIDGSPYSEPLSRNQIDGNTSRTSWWNWRRNKGRTAVESIELASQSSA